MPTVLRHLMSYYCRPLEKTAHFGNYYWPDGIPKGSSHTADQTEYSDANGNHFFICYTQEQVLDQVKRWGYFAPFIPLMVTDSIG
jgi:hypothetical protein